jgi:hypothetical protein
MCLWKNKVICHKENFLMIVSLGDWCPQLASQDSGLKPTGLLCMGMDERNGLQC